MNIHKSSIGPIWRPLKEIYEYYLAHTLYDGQSAAELIRSNSEQKRLYRSFHQLANALPRTKPKSDILMLEQVKTFDEKTGEVLADIQRRMRADASKGSWFAEGKRNPDSKHELILPRHWAFLRLDIDLVRQRAMVCLFMTCAVPSRMRLRRMTPFPTCPIRPTAFQQNATDCTEKECRDVAGPTREQDRWQAYMQGSGSREICGSLQSRKYYAVA